ncbi:MAG: ABC-type Fe3+-hydroxamate transport system substrate-binding protein [Planctomycetota bacterium]|jgi:ABC-type Fe3+-hydroxamate transport system substrate-binding protein
MCATFLKISSVVLVFSLSTACFGGGEEAPGAFFHGQGLDGMELNLDSVPRSVLPATSGSAEIILELLPRERIAGIPRVVFDFSAGFGEPEDWGDSNILERYRGEDVLALRPDLVLTSAFQDMDTTSLLRREGVPVLGFPTVSRFSDVTDAVEILGRVLDCEEQAGGILREMESRRAALAQRAVVWKGREALLYTNYGTGGWTQGIESAGEVLLGLAGLVNSAGLGELQGPYQIANELLIALDPAVIICGSDMGDFEASAGYLMKNPVLRKLSAVRNKRVIVLPSTLLQSTSHRMLDAAEALVVELERLGLTADGD